MAVLFQLKVKHKSSSFLMQKYILSCSFLSMRHMPCFWTDNLPFPRYWPLGLSFLYF
jgi:hypothetical protein